MAAAEAINHKIRLPVALNNMPPCVEHAIHYGPEDDDGMDWAIILSKFWRDKGASQETFPLYLKVWYNDSGTVVDLEDRDFDSLCATGWESETKATCADFIHSMSFSAGCTKTACPFYNPPDQAPKIDIPRMDVEYFLGNPKAQPVNIAVLAEELVKSLNIKRLPGGTLAVYNNGVYITEDSEFLIDTVVRNYLKNELNTRLKSNLLLHIKALADSVVWDDFEKYPNLLCCPNCVVDLTTGQALDHDPVYMMLHKTRVLYRPKAGRALWEKVLDEIVQDATFGAPDKEITEDQTAYYKTIWGMSITGETRDEIVPIHQGPGASGKTTITSAIQYAMGSYIQQVDPDILISKGDVYKPSYELAMGVGKRIFLTNESKEGAKINTQLIKMIATEGAEFNARQIREKPFTYTLRAKAHLVMNPQPILDEQDKSVQRRLHLIKYGADFSKKPDKTLKKKLQAEAEGILAWLIEGSMGYYANGLTTSDAVSCAVQELFDASDPLYGFIEANLSPTGNKADKVTSRALFKAFKSHCSGMMVNTDKFDPRPFGRALNSQLKLKGWKYKTYPSNGETIYTGMEFKSVNEGGY